MSNTKVTCNTVEVGSTEVVVEDKDTIRVQSSINVPVVDTEFSIQVSPRTYQIVSQDLYTIKRNTELEPWFEDMIDDMIDNGDLADEVSDLEDMFNNFEDGVTMEIGYLKNADEELAYDLTVVKVSNDQNTAGILNLDLTKITADTAVALSRETIAAWQNGTDSGAWFDSQITVVSNVAYSAAKSASTLTASINSQQDQLAIIAGDIETLEKQVDGKVVTWFIANADNPDGLPWDPIGPVLPDNTINPDGKPYFCWLAGNNCSDPVYEDDSEADVRIEHTGDTYVYFEYDANGAKQILSTWRFGVDPVSGEFNWYIFKDDLASEAYQSALDAQATADSKIVTFYQSFPPPANESSLGDLWIDSSTDEHVMSRFDGTNWVKVDNRVITAKVNRLDEAVVDIDGTARAKSSLDVITTVGGNQAVAGYVLESTNGVSSSFAVYADRFQITSKNTGYNAGAPFSVEGNKIAFTGQVTFNKVPVGSLYDDGTYTDDTRANEAYILAQDSMSDEDVVQLLSTEATTTVINGANIRTGHMVADRISGKTFWTNGMIKSQDYHGNTSGYVPNSNPAGFMLNGAAGTGSYNYPNVYGSYIRGSIINGSTIEAGTLIAPNIIYKNSYGLEFEQLLYDTDNTSSGHNSILFGWGIYPPGSSSSNRVGNKIDVTITLNGTVSIDMAVQYFYINVFVALGSSVLFNESYKISNSTSMPNVISFITTGTSGTSGALRMELSSQLVNFNDWKTTAKVISYQ